MFLVLLVGLSVRRITYKVMNGFARIFYHRCVSGQGIISNIVWMIRITIRIQNTDLRSGSDADRMDSPEKNTRGVSRAKDKSIKFCDDTDYDTDPVSRLRSIILA